MDYANNPGYWVVVTEANKTLPIPAQQGTVWGSLPMTATNVVDENNLVRTLRFWACDVLGDTHDGEAQVYWTDCENFPPFTVVYAPIQMVQLKVAPFAILYAPPGDASTATFKITNTYKAAVTLGSGTKMSDSGTSQAGYAANFSLNAGTKLYADATLNLGESWDTGTITGYGNGINNTNVSTGTQVSSISYLTVADYSLIPGTGETCSTVTNCSILVPPPATMVPPFLHDIFILNIHPQYAIWSFSPANTQYLLTAAVPSFALVSVASLAACAGGGPPLVSGIDPCQVSFADTQNVPSGNEVISEGISAAVTLTANEASNLLQLDPFYSQRSQNASLTFDRATKIAGSSYGSATYGVPQPSTNGPVDQAGPAVPLTETNTMATDITTAKSTDYVSGETSTMQSTLGFSETASILGMFGWSDSWASSNKTTDEYETTLTYGDSSTVSATLATEADAILQDYDNTMQGASGPLCKNCHGPLNFQPNVVISLDRKFGGYMFQDPNAPLVLRPLSISVINGVVLANLINTEQKHVQFSDVAASDPANAAMGIMARSGIIPAAANGAFMPNAPITQSNSPVPWPRRSG